MDENQARDTEIIQFAYAERLKEAFSVFAENLGMGQPEKSCKERFIRALELTRKARDLALEAMHGIDFIDFGADPLPPEKGVIRQENSMENLSAEDQEMIHQMLEGTTGHKAPTTRR